MRTIRVTFVRTFSRLWVSWTALAGTGAFLALSGVGFVRALMRGDGGSVPVAALWAAGGGEGVRGLRGRAVCLVAPCVPVRAVPPTS